MPTKTLKEAVDAIMSMLEDWGCFEGIAFKFKDEIGKEIADVIVETWVG